MPKFTVFPFDSWLHPVPFCRMPKRKDCCVVKEMQKLRYLIDKVRRYLQLKAALQLARSRWLDYGEKVSFSRSHSSYPRALFPSAYL